MPLDLTALRRTTAELGLPWQPGETVHSGLSTLQARARLGAIPPGGPAALAHREAAAASARDTAAEPAAAPPPPAFDWRKAAGGNYVSPVKDQAGCGSCVAFGTTAVLESMVRIRAKHPGLTVDLSEAHAFFCYGPSHGAGRCPDGGWWPDDALGAMKSGLSDEATFRYTDADQPCHLAADWRTRLTTFSHWTTRTSRASMKAYLATVGPMSACFTVYEDFFYHYTSGVYTYHEKTSGNVVGGHCVAIIGYDDAHSCWIAKNSWGTGWGEQGFFRIAYGSAGIDAEMWGIDGTIGSPLIRTALHVVGAGDGNLWHTLRRGDGTWQQAVDRIDVAPAGDPGTFTAVATAATINCLHLVGLVGGQPRHTRRLTGSAWSPFGRPPSTAAADMVTCDAVDCAAAGDTLHVVALGGGAIWHTLRKPNGTWQSAWGRVSGAPGPFDALACSTAGGSLHVLGVSAGGLWHRLRNPDGTWTPAFTAVPSQLPEPLPFSGVAAAALDSVLHVVGLAAGRLWHTSRSTGGTWPASFEELTSTNPSAPTAYDSVACAEVGTTLQVVALAQGRLWHKLRDGTGAWSPSFGSIGNQITGAPATFLAVDCG